MNNHNIIINFCPTGMVVTKAKTKFVPVSVNEVIEQTHEAYQLGITIVHLHARDNTGKPSWEPKIYQQIIEGVRRHCEGLLICCSTSGRDFNEFEKRSAVIELKPDMCSLTLSSLNFMHSASVNAPDTIQALAQKMMDFGVHPELECFDLGMINYGHYLIKKGLIKGPFYWNLIFGNIFGLQLKPDHIAASLNDIDDEGHFVSLGGLADNQLKANAIAIALGYGVRVGLEDNIWWDNERTQLATNQDLIKRIHRLMDLHGKKMFKSEDFGGLGFYNAK